MNDYRIEVEYNLHKPYMDVYVDNLVASSNEQRWMLILRTFNIFDNYVSFTFFLSRNTLIENTSF